MPDEPAQSEPIPVEPIPVEPIPVEALPVEAIPVEPIPAIPPPFYMPPMPRLGPPRLVVAMGVWSIIVASVGLIGGPIATLVMAAAVGIRNAPVPGKFTPPTNLKSQAEVVSTGGYGSADRTAAFNGLSRLQQLTAGQQLQLDELLAESGRDVLPLGSPLDPAVVAAAVSQSGQLGTFGTSTNESPTYFAMANGRLELTESRAVFFPGAGQPAIRAVAYALPPLSADASPLLTDDAVRSTLRAIAEANGNRPKSVQVQALITTLRGVSQQVVVPTTDGTDPAAEVVQASTDPDGTLTVETVHGTTTCETTITAAGVLSATLGSTLTAAQPPPVNPASLGFVVILTGVEWLLAIYLLVISILTVRRSSAGRLLHWIYVGLKLPVAAGAMIATVALANQLATGNTHLMWMSPAIAGLIYPAALVLVLLSRSVREYYGSGGVTFAGTRSAPW